MRELDLVLDGWLERCYAEAAPAARQAFCDLLERPDPQIFDYLTDREIPDSVAMRELVDALKRLHHDANG
jgi:succinate dehydrogenase flavin-adding protein (antitoxin of CptAB toxin-antitoxin module)